MKESRAEMQISVNLLQLENVLKQVYLRKKWMYETPLNENLQEVSFHELYIY